MYQFGLPSLTMLQGNSNISPSQRLRLTLAHHPHLSWLSPHAQIQPPVSWNGTNGLLSAQPANKVRPNIRSIRLDILYRIVESIRSSPVERLHTTSTSKSRQWHQSRYPSMQCRDPLYFILLRPLTTLPRNCAATSSQLRIRRLSDIHVSA
jgi:hypothetical protein